MHMKMPALDVGTLLLKADACAVCRNAETGKELTNLNPIHSKSC